MKHDFWTENIEERFDVITFFGVLSWFNDFERVADKLIKMLNDGGRAYIFDKFNKYGYRVAYDYSIIDSDGIKKHNVEYEYLTEECGNIKKVRISIFGSILTFDRECLLQL